MKHKVSKLPNGRWELVFRPHGADGKQVRKRFDTKSEADRYAALVKGRVLEGKPWNPSPKPADTRRLTDLVEEWFKVHGHALKSGDSRKSKMLYLCAEIGNPYAAEFDQRAYADARAMRLESGVGLSTVNHDLAYLKAMFNDLRRAGRWKGENPLSLVRKVRVDETEMAFLTHDQIRELLRELRKCLTMDAYKVTKLCLATGARWTEAESITGNMIKNGVVRFANTKNGKGRSVPIGDELERELKDGQPGGFERLFQPCIESFRGAMSRCSFTLPRGQLTHVLRHTFASQFVQAGGDILTLQKVLGHSTINMTMRYAHLAPDHMRVVLDINPLAQISRQPACEKI